MLFNSVKRLFLAIIILLFPFIVFLKSNSHYLNSPVEVIQEWHPRIGKFLYYVIQNSIFYFILSVIAFLILETYQHYRLNSKNKLFKAHMNNIVVFWVIFLGGLLFYYFFYEALSMSMTLTFNGVWKSLSFSEYKSGNTSALENGGILYYPFLKVFTKLLNFNHPTEYYKAIVYFNGICSSFTLSIFFLFAKNILFNAKSALIAVAFHFICPGIFLLSINNEDILPSYMFYVCSIYFFFLYLKNSAPLYLIFCVFSMSLSLLFHWTSGLPAFFSLFIYLLFFDKKPLFMKMKNICRVILVSVSIFLVVSFVFDISLLSVIYPAKGDGTLWVSGVTLEKIPVVFVNTFSFFWLGMTFRTLSYIIPIATIPLLIISLYYIYLLVWEKEHYVKNKPVLEMLLFLIFVFIIGSAMNYYEQGSDAQFFIQPQFLFIYAFVILLYVLWEKPIKYFGRIVLFPAFIVFSIGLILRIAINKDCDKKSFQNVEIVKKEIKNPEKTLFISRGFDNFIPLAALFWGNIHFLHFPRGESAELEMDDKEYLIQSVEQIEQYLSDGFEIVMIDFVNQNVKDLGTSFYGYDLTSKMELIQNYFTENYNSKIIEGTYRYTFFKLNKK